MSEPARILPLPGLRPAFFNIVKMPECQVVTYRRAFRVSAGRVIAGDYTEFLEELRGMRVIDDREYTVTRTVQWHDYFDVTAVGEELPSFRLHASAHTEEHL